MMMMIKDDGWQISSDLGFVFRLFDFGFFFYDCDDDEL